MCCVGVRIPGPGSGADRPLGSMSISQRTLVVYSLVTSFLGTAGTARLASRQEKIDQLTSIVAETGRFLRQRISPLNSRARMRIRKTVLRHVLKNFSLLDQLVTIARNHRVGVRR